MNKMIDNMVKKMLEEGIADRDNLIGCSEEEIKDIEQRFHLKLPGLYKDFLRVMGRKAGNLFYGENMFYPEVLKFQENAKFMMMNDDLTAPLIELPPTAFVFGHHQGEQFLFFLTSESDDPSVYHYLEGKDFFTKSFDKLSELYETALSSAINNKWFRKGKL
jgi:hypothetical protein